MSARRFVLLAAASAALLLPASASAFESVEVTSTGDPGSGCSLRDAVTAVVSAAPTGGCTPTTEGTEDKIFFDDALSGQTITLDGGGGQVSLDDPEGLSLIGDGMNATIVAAGSGNRVFSLNSGSVEIEGMTIRDGSQSGDAPRGGCFFNRGELLLIEVRLTNCTATGSSASNHTYADGGAIGQENPGSLELRDSLVDGNEVTATNTANDMTEAQARGGAIYSESAGGVSLTRTTISDNEATASDDGAMDGSALAVGGIAGIGGGEIEISESTISENVATATAETTNGYGLTAGGLYLNGPGSLELSTVAGNIGDVTTGGAQTLHGGGIYVAINAATFEIRSSTIALNGPDSLTGIDGGNLFLQNGTTTLANTILADPRGGADNCLNIGGTLTSNGFNDDYSPGGASCFTVAGTDLDSDPMLAPGGLADNGGPTETIALQNASPVIDQGSSADQADEGQDQRGSLRPLDFTGLADAAGGDGSDIGAFEVQKACPEQTNPIVSCPDPNPPVNPPATTGKRAKALKKCKKIKNKKKRKKCKKKAKKQPV